jgi:hypothetical protein
MSDASEKLVGEVSNYFNRISVAGINLTATVKVGDSLHFKGANTDFIQVVDSLQIDRNFVSEAKAGFSIGIKVKMEVRKGDKVYVAN